MLIFKLLDQYEGICRRAFFVCSVKLNNAKLVKELFGLTVDAA